jgi:hypothetical protein
MPFHFPFVVQALPRSIRKRNTKFDDNVNKRGNVPLGKVENKKDEFPVSKSLIALFFFLVVGSSVVSVLNLFGRAPVFSD